ncbi:DNA-binding transcriptional response regulator [Planctomycetes bacterium Pan216]|uniref:DNA-binding transcriptional response regulator n=1 Tax=Kolteria novifilia TaxID=2527975 RepID=A0A518B644_9BACT|nr:DNA-binding transcriptional response regulator [Planctomycetes bacterium Pan216]
MAEDQIRVLVVDDEEPHAQAVAESLERTGYECSVAATGAEGIRLIETEEFEIVITDLVMGEVDGLDVLRKARQELPDAEVIVITGHGTIQTAVSAMQQGATTYLTKPLDINELRTVVDKATERQRLHRTNVELRRQLDEKFGFEGVIGNSIKMNEVLARLRLVSPSPATVLITGENGTGKELVAQAIHNNSPRRHKAFVALNCAALSEGILESELFGHERGAFTGADKLRKGRFEYAHGGTLFLDEVGDLPMSTQIKLLRVIESREIMRVGANEPIPVNVRLVSATNRDLEEMVADGLFRQDLYYRLKVVKIQLPPLRERREDIPLLCDHFLRDMSTIYDRPVPTISTAVMRVLRSADWPGNVRELRNTIESMFVIDEDGRLDLDDLPDELQGAQENVSGGGQESLVGKPLDVVEAYYIEQALKLTEGNREEAAKMLGIGERTLYRKIKQFDIPNPKSDRRRKTAAVGADSEDE